MRLDQLIQKSLGLTRKQARVLLSTRTVVVNGIVNMNGGTRLSDFDKVMKDTQVLQQRIPRYLLLHKPIGIVSATIDQEHTTVIDLIREPWADELHLAGRLDRASSGLVVLTNDGHYSRKLTRPEHKVPKTYLVGANAEITPEMVAAFRKGMPFAKEGIRTHPAIVNLIGTRNLRACRLTIYEGKHHQIKRMFLRFGVKVIRLHRESIGDLELGDLQPGAYREFTADPSLLQ